MLLHVGPGMTNAVTGVLTAALDSVPLVAITGDIPSYYYGRHPHQEVNLHADADQTAIYRPFVKRAWQVHRVADLARFTERAFWTATSGRPGAVLLSVPMDHFSRPVPRDTAGAFPLAAPERPGLPADVAERIADLLVAAERPLVYLGGGLRRGPGLDALRSLVEHLDIPVAHSLMAKGTLPDSHPLLLGMPGFWGLELTNRYTREADVVLALATRFAETDASSWDRRYTWQFPPGRLIQIDIDPAEIGRNFPVDRRRGRRRHRRRAGDRRRRPRPAARTAAAGRAAGDHHARPAATLFTEQPGTRHQRPVPAAARTDPHRPAGDPAARRRPRHRRRLEQERCRPVLRAARRGALHHAGRRLDDGLRPGGGGRRPDRPARPHRRRPDRRRRHERPAARACRWPSSRAPRSSSS